MAVSPLCGSVRNAPQLTLVFLCCGYLVPIQKNFYTRKLQGHKPNNLSISVTDQQPSEHISQEENLAKEFEPMRFLRREHRLMSG